MNETKVLVLVGTHYISYIKHSFNNVKNIKYINWIYNSTMARMIYNQY